MQVAPKTPVPGYTEPFINTPIDQLEKFSDYFKELMEPETIG